MNKLKAIFCAALSVCVISVPLVSSFAINAGAEETQSLEERIAELDAKSAEYQAVLDATASDIKDKEAYAKTLTDQIKVMNEKIILTHESVDKMEKDIKDKQAEIENSNKEIDEQVDALGERLSIIYMQGNARNLEIVLGAKSFDDLIDKVMLVKTLTDYDKATINEINCNITNLEKQKSQQETDKSKLVEEENKLKKDISDLNELIKKNQAVLAELTAKSSAAKASLANVNSKTAALEAEYAAQIAREQEAAKNNTMTAEQQQKAKEAAAEAQKAEAQQRQQQQQTESGSSSGSSSSGSSSSGSSSSGSSSSGGSSSGGSSSGGSSYSDSGYTWPCPGFYFLSSLFSEDRTTYTHGGIDIAGGDIWGAAVVAADSGTVWDTNTTCTHNYPKDFSESCGCGGGYGNYVWIDHGNGKESIYGHLTSVVVSPGQSVSKGQVIGYVGTTGHSTGAHLHFECRYYNTRYNPMDELSSYWGMVSY